jgi:hypothetical protein
MVNHPSAATCPSRDGETVRPRVWLTTPSGDLVDLTVGDLIGRMPSCALCLNDPRVSEAHALVSLRGDELKLLALRGRLEVRARSCADVTLRPGLAVSLAPNVTVTVEAIDLPDEVPAVRLDGGPPLTLLGTTSVRAGPPAELVPGWAADADAWLWAAGDAWFLQLPNEAARAVGPGDEAQVGRVRLTILSAALATAGNAATVLDGHREPLRLTLRYHNIVLATPNRSVQIDGIPGRLLCEVAAMGGPTSWEVVAREIWDDDANLDSLRRRWDVNLARLRARLRESGLRGDLLRADRSGNIELHLHPDDVIVDEM